MEIINVTNLKQLKQIADKRAVIWRGVNERSYSYIMQECCTESTGGTGYTISGKLLNEYVKKDVYGNDEVIFALIDTDCIPSRVGANWLN